MIFTFIFSKFIFQIKWKNSKRRGFPIKTIKTNKDPECPHAKETAHPFAFLPFGFGARMCVGRRFAELEIEVLVTRLVQNYKIEWNYDDMKIKSVLVNVPDGDLKFKFTEIVWAPGRAKPVWAYYFDIF